jgi:hypothetical protein
MFLVGRNAKAYGAGSPILLAHRYGLLSDSFFDGLNPYEKILGDHHILNCIIQADNEAQEKAMKKAKEKGDHPGMERYEDPEDFWDEVNEANTH